MSAQPSSEQVAESQATVSHAQKIAQAAVPMQDVVREFGEERLTIEPDGTWNVHLEGRDEVERFEAMDQQRSRLEEAAGDAAVASRHEVTVKARDGSLRLMPEAVAARLGLHAPIRWGRPSVRIRVVNGKLVETRLR